MRYPAVSGRFYPSDERTLRKEIESCFRDPIGPGMPGKCMNTDKLVSVIAPHAGYRASGMNAAHAYKAIAEDGLPDVYVVIGPDHHGIPYDAALCGEPYVTPLGVCNVHEDIVKKLRTMIPDDPHAHKYEHSVEVQVPFIQYIDGNAKIVPIIMSDQSEECARYIADAIKEACADYRYVVVASSDMSHYVPKNRASEESRKVIERICAMDVPGMYDIISENKITSCGYGPMAVAMMSGGSSAKELKYSDSYDSLGTDKREVVGYLSVAFTK